jgi:hypothetical protein
MSNTSSRNANVAFSITGADASKREIEKVRAAVEALGDKGKKSAQGIVDGMQGVDRAFATFDRKILETGNVTDRDMRKMVAAVESLRTNTIRAFGSMAAAPKELQDAVEKAEHKMQEASTTVGRLNNAVRDQAAHTQAASGQWSGLGNSIEAAAGKQGKYVAGAGLVTAAWAEGWAIGMKLNKLFGTDMTLWEEETARFGAKAGIIVKDIADIIIAEATAVWEVLHGNFSEAKRSFAEAGQDIQKLGKDASDVINKWGADWDRLHPKIKENKEAVKDLTAAVDASKTAIDAHTVAVSEAEEKATKLAEVQSRLKQKYDDVSAAIGREKQALEAAQMAEIDAEHGVINRTSDMGSFSRELDRATQELDRQKQKVAALAAEFGESNPITRSAIEKQTELERSLALSQQRFDGAKHDTDLYSAAQRQAQTAVQQHKEKVSDLSTEQGRLQTELAGATTAANNAADAATRVANSVTAAVTATSGLASSAAHLATASGQAKEALSQVPESMHLDAWRELNTLAASVKSHLADIAHSVAPAATDALRELGKAAASAAGHDEGGPSVQGPQPTH